MYSALETLLLKACKQLDYQDELQLVKSLYDKDINYKNLKIQFQTIAPSVKDNLSLGGIVSYRIMQIVRSGKLSRLHALLVIHGKIFAIVWPVQFAEKSGTT